VALLEERQRRRNLQQQQDKSDHPLALAGASSETLESLVKRVKRKNGIDHSQRGKRRKC